MHTYVTNVMDMNDDQRAHQNCWEKPCLNRSFWVERWTYTDPKRHNQEYQPIFGVNFQNVELYFFDGELLVVSKLTFAINKIFKVADFARAEPKTSLESSADGLVWVASIF